MTWARGCISFSCILSISNGMVSCAIWKKKHTLVSFSKASLFDSLTLILETVQYIIIIIYIINKSNSMVSSAIWKKHTLVSFSKTSNCTRPSVTCNFDRLWNTHSCMFFPNCTRNHTITYTNNRELSDVWLCSCLILLPIRITESCLMSDSAVIWYYYLYE